MLRIDVVTIFPKIFQAVIGESIIKRAQSKKKVLIKIHDLRDYADNRHRKIDDRPFGGGPGMVMSPTPVFNAIKKIKAASKVAKVVLLTPQGTKLDQNKTASLSKEKRLILLCPHYEGIDERVRQDLVDEEISIGDYILTGGELPALVVIDALVRLIPGVLGDQDSIKSESFVDHLLEYPHYTRPANLKGKKVPKILLSGNHKEIESWRQEQSILKTKKKRPDLYEKYLKKHKKRK
jgi:tRNA (guanine37-N1)-methyltransferase